MSTLWRDCYRFDAFNLIYRDVCGIMNKELSYQGLISFITNFVRLKCRLISTKVRLPIWENSIDIF